MPSLRDEITRTFLRFGRKGSPGDQMDDTAAGVSSALLPDGTELGSYRVLKHLGTGGMGNVYLALDTQLNRKVALKLLPPELTANPGFFRRFEQEARTASALNHPNILTILGFPEISGRRIIVSEYIEGQTLRALLARKIELPRALDIAIQIASALSAAHAAGVVHRDLKPTNIMIRPDGYVKVIDFGLAKLAQRRAGASAVHEPWTQPGAVLGTVGYMSPEQAKGEETDTRSDIWSIGVILYEMVARGRPFEGSTDSHVVVAILDDPPRPIPEGEKLPAELLAVISRALAKDKKARYQTAEAMLSDLKRVQESLGSAKYPLRLTPPKRSVPFSGIYATGALTLAIAFTTWWWPLGGRWKVLGPKWFELGTSRRLTFQGNVSLATISPDGTQLAYVSGPAGNETFRILELRTNAERQLPATTDDYLGLTFSPDSKTLFYVLKDRQAERGRLLSVPVAGVGTDPPSIVLEDIEGPIALSPLGDRFAFVRGRAEGNREVNQVLMGLASNPRNLSAVLSLYGTDMKARLAWSPRNDWLSAVTYPSRLSGATQATVSLFRLDGHLLKSFSPEAIRRLDGPIVLDGGSLLAFAGMPLGAEQNHFVQLFTPTGEFRETSSDILGFESLSATADSKTIAAVRFDERCSIWTADADALQSAHALTPDSERISSVDWLGNDSLVFPSTRSGNVNLAELQSDGIITMLAKPQACVQNEPVSVPGRSMVVYASNCGSRGDDFNLWAVNLPDGKLRRLTSGANYDYQPSVSPDGRWVYYTSWSSNIPSIWKIPIDGGTPTRVLQSQALTPVLSPDGTRFVSTVREDHGRWEVAIVSSANGEVLKRLPQVPIRRPIRWSPDGNALDYVRDDNLSSAILRQPLTGGSPQILVRVPEGTIASFSWNRSGTKLAYVRARDQRDAILFTRATKK
jgi:eukaryotic-like serine/threonine-protein kinase